ncbi:MAG TPA: penicillin-binding protein 1A [Gammaproteobacteria bacterium]|nr:penicillin-binding protein 1A [Gammaproteobacteria bacterium]
MFFYLLLLASIGVAVVAAVLYVKIEPQLPSIDVLRDVQLQEPLRIYASDMQLLAEFGEKRRNPVKISQVPDAMVQAFLAAEDDRFFQHAGVDFQGLLRAAVELLRTGKKRQGGSTITMQVARNFFLSSEKTYLRKLTEILLAYKIEGSLSKEEILELYLNKIYLGQRAYGVEAAAQVYYGMSIADLSVARMAMIAALPKAPSRINPINNPESAVDRRNYVLGRMHQLGYLDTTTYEAAIAEPDGARLHRVQADASAAYVAEMVRHEMVQRFGDSAYTSGYEVVTTINVPRQAAATRALRKDLLNYSKRHGYRGAEASVDISEVPPEEWVGLLSDYVEVGELEPALVTRVDEKSIEVLLKSNETVSLGWESISWARPYRSVNRLGAAPKQAGDIVAKGDVVRVSRSGGDWELGQIPVVEGALVSLRPTDGAVLALVGGFDFKRSKFNRATQARRQPGSSFKPIIYSAALEKGFTPASIINDAPVVFDDSELESTWRPENYSGQFYGPTRLREALYRSRNLVSIRILRAIGAGYAATYAENFGFSSGDLPHDLTLALGSASVTPLQMARAYSVLANGGYLINPYFISSIRNAAGEVVFMADSPVVCPHCPEMLEDIVTGGRKQVSVAPQVLSPQNVWLMTSMMRDVIQRGTGRKARVLGRSDLAGKTGTTNDQMDGWFSGFNHALVATAWVGFDKLEPLGRGETGGRSALPMWIDYMREALQGIKEVIEQPPEGLVTVRIDPVTGLLARSGQQDAIFETFMEDSVPTRTSDPAAADGLPGGGGAATDQLF